jgi:small subunit ribosomal protein S14
MAKKSVIARNEKRKRLAAKYQAKREKLLAVANDRNLSIAEVFQARQELALLPRNSAPTRIANRCVVTGRKRAFYRKFKVSRIVLRDWAGAGLLPGVKKASW